MAKVINIWQGEYQLAVGYNNAAGLRGLEGIFISNDFQPFKAFRSWGTYSPGEVIIRGDGTEAYDGYPTCQWIFGGMTRLQLDYLMTTYCGGGYSGRVTVRTVTDAVGVDGRLTYANFNAVMRLTRLPDATVRGRAYANYPITFTRMVAL